MNGLRGGQEDRSPLTAAAFRSYGRAAPEVKFRCLVRVFGGRGGPYISVATPDNLLDNPRILVVRAPVPGPGEGA